MKAGNLKDIIELEERKLISNTYGEQTTEYNKCKTCRCEVIYGEGKRTLENDEILFNYNPTFKIRSYHQINDTMRVKYKNKYYRIIAIIPNSARFEQTIITELINI